MMWQVARALCLAGACLSILPAWAVPADGKRGDLSALREKIRDLQDDIAHSEENHGEAADELAASDKSIAATQMRLREIARSREQAEAQIASLNEQRVAIENELSVLRKQLGDAIFRTYVEGGQGGARSFLSGDNPNQISRDAYYLEQIARQRMQAITQARGDMQKLAQIMVAAEARRSQLVALEAQRKDEQATLVRERAKQREVLNQISTQLRSQRRQMATLQRDEGRMEKLIQGLDRIARSLPPRVPRAVASAPVASSGANSSRASHSKDGGREPVPQAGKEAEGGKESSSAQKEPVTGRADAVAQPDHAEISFGARRGHLRWPVRGELTGHFGVPRMEGGATWRGIFIRAANGTEVHAVADGKVVFADWMRGFGNLIIVEHGDGYLTVYGNNESVFKSPGDDVSTGDVIASVGTSGGQEESGLYFEIRYRGQPQDPAKWVAGKSTR